MPSSTVRVDHTGQLLNNKSKYIGKPRTVMISDKKSPSASDGWAAPLAQDGKPSSKAGSKSKKKGSGKKKTKNPNAKPKVTKKKDSKKSKKGSSKKDNFYDEGNSSSKKKTSSPWYAYNASDDPHYKTEKTKIRVRGKEVEVDKPPKTLLIIWVLMLAELLLDFVTSGIAFAAFLGDPGQCCGQPINTGAGPLSAAIPFFFLVFAELIFLLRAIKLTLWPNKAAGDEENPESKKGCCKKMGPKFMMWIINLLTVINPFFGFAIAWMLMYQSDKTEALTVMILELVTIILHFVSVHLEKGAETWQLKLMHGIIIIPWLATLGINLWYLNKGGVCYDTSLETFWYKGCEICPNGVPALADTETTSKCARTTFVNGTNVTEYDTFYVWDLSSAEQCGGEKDVCWFPF